MSIPLSSFLAVPNVTTIHQGPVYQHYVSRYMVQMFDAIEQVFVSEILNCISHRTERVNKLYCF